MSDAVAAFIDYNSAEDKLNEAATKIVESAEAIERLIESKTMEPGNDIISGLLAEHYENNHISRNEIIAASLLLSAGNHTSACLIANGWYQLLAHPDQYRRIQANRDILPDAVDEIIRYDPPVILTSRWVSEDLKISGHSMIKYKHILIALGAANRDPAVLTDPDTFDITRRPNRHLSFSAGPHYCLGAPLVRMEAETALEILLLHLQNPELLEQPVRTSHTGFRGLKRLMVRTDIV